jgi:hypothetical protein
MVRVYQQRPIIKSTGNIRGLALLLDPREYPTISPANNTFIIKSSGLAEDPSTSKAVISEMPIKRKLHLHLSGIQYFSQSFNSLSCLNLFGVHITDLGIGVIPATTLSTALILILSFAAKLIYTQTSNHQTPTNRRQPRHPGKTVF